MQRVAPATNALPFSPLADHSLAYLWPVQAQHRYGNSLPTSLLLLSMPKQYPETPSYCSAILSKSSPRLFFSSRCLAIVQYCLTMHSLCSSSPSHVVSSLRRSNSRRIFSIPCHRSSLLPWPLQNIALLVRFFCRDVAALFFCFSQQCPAELLQRHISRRFSSCVASRRVAVASPIDASCCFSTTFLCLSFSLQS